MSTESPESKKTSANPDAEESITFKRSHFFLALLPIAFVLGISVGYIFWGLQPFTSSTNETKPVTQQGAGESQVADRDNPVNQDEASAQNPSGEDGDTTPQQVKRYDVPEGDNPSLGSEDAPITIIEFSDYECPFCRRWHDEVFDKIRDEYPDQVRFVYRDFPLTSLHPNAVPAAEAASCANEQDAFWEFSEMLYSDEYGFGEEAYVKYAQVLELDVPGFEECIEEGRYSDEVQADYEFASSLGVRSTPTFFLNGIAVVGAQPFEVFQDVIEKELAGEIP
ncbi:MAG: thioredoxin domain-containing protein [Anaerolineales bacterium]